MSHSASSQFFINTNNNAFLDHTNKSPKGRGCAVFGKVIEGQDVMDKIGKVSTTAIGPFRSDVPYIEIVIHIMSIIEEPQ